MGTMLRDEEVAKLKILITGIHEILFNAPPETAAAEPTQGGDATVVTELDKWNASYAEAGELLVKARKRLGTWRHVSQLLSTSTLWVKKNGDPMRPPSEAALGNATSQTRQADGVRPGMGYHRCQAVVEILKPLMD